MERVDNSPYGVIRNTWYVAGFSGEFEPLVLNGQVIANKPVVIWRDREGDVVAFDNRCVHKRFPLSEGKLLPDGTLQCAYHGLCYNKKGECIDVPSHPGREIPRHARLNRYPVVERDGVVWIWVGDVERMNGTQPPTTPEIGGGQWEVATSEPMRVPANYLLLIENLLDVTHFYPLHDGNVGDREAAEIPIEFDEGREDGNEYIVTTREVSNYRQPPFLVDWLGYEVVDRVHTHKMVSPATTRVEMRVAPPGELGTGSERGYVIYHTHTPIDHRSHVWRWTLSMKGSRPSDEEGVSAVQKAARMFPEVVAQDLWALEKQQEMFEIPDGGYSELFLTPDFALRRARKIFVDLIDKEKAQERKRH